jgi:hypothetical protein
MAGALDAMCLRRSPNPCHKRRARHTGSSRRRRLRPGRVRGLATPVRSVRARHAACCKMFYSASTRTNEADGPFFESRLMCGLCLIVRKFELILCRFLVVYVAGIATAKPRELSDKNVLTSRRDVKYRPRHPCFLHIQRERTIKLDLIHRLVCWPECLVNLE